MPAILVLLGAAMIALGIATSGDHGPFGKFPGDIVIQGAKTVTYIPIGTSILVSLLIGLLVWIISIWMDR